MDKDFITYLECVGGSNDVPYLGKQFRDNVEPFSENMSNLLHKKADYSIL